MPPVIKQEGSRFVVYSHEGGHKLGTHPTRAQALEQQRAVFASISAAAKRQRGKGG